MNLSNVITSCDSVSASLIFWSNSSKVGSINSQPKEKETVWLKGVSSKPSVKLNVAPSLRKWQMHQ